MSLDYEYYSSRPRLYATFMATTMQIKEVTNGDPMEISYLEGKILLEGYPKGEDEFTPDAYCRDGLLDRHGTLQLNR